MESGIRKSAEESRMMRLLVLFVMISITRSYKVIIFDETLVNLYGPTREYRRQEDRVYSSPETQTQSASINDQIEREIIIDSLFVKHLSPNNGQTRNIQRVTTVDAMVTTTAATNGDRRHCQCVPYDHCNINYVDIYENDPDITGTGRIDIRFDDDGCQENMKLCCRIPKPLTESQALKPNVTNSKGCGFSNPNGIVFTIVEERNGSASQFGEFPWVVALLDTLNDSYVGVGTLIHPQVVLTAAHIASKYQTGGLKIRAGEWDTKTIKEPLAHQERLTQAIYIHPDFNRRKLLNDIAVLHLKQPVELAEHINTICLPDAGEIFDDSKSCVANGWGKNRFDKDDEFEVVLKKIELDMVEHSHCNDLLRYTELGARYNLHSSFVCAGGEEGKDMCTGDGGGPLACPISNNRYKLAGLVAGGVGCGQKNVPGVYASLAALRSWVDEIMRLIGYGTSSYTL